MPQRRAAPLIISYQTFDGSICRHFTEAAALKDVYSLSLVSYFAFFPDERLTRQRYALVYYY